MTFMLYGTFFMVGSAYTLKHKGHIRTDSFYGDWSPRRQGWVDTVCYLVFFFPPLIAFLVATSEYFWKSYGQDERIMTSPWMPLVWPFKFAMPLAAALLLLQGVSELLKSIHAARKGVWL
jgi:TRAP-type mannitol/chloroaromatic compound transport system permease small subunit